MGSASARYSAGMESSGKGAHARHAAQAPMATHGEHVPAERAQARGLAIVEGGLRFEAEPTIVVAGENVDFSFTIVGQDGHPVTSFEELHERRMHLIVVRRDLTGFQHLHPDIRGRHLANERRPSHRRRMACVRRLRDGWGSVDARA
jgi:hypothetical protein